MGFKTDIEIAQETTMSPITEIAAKAGIDDEIPGAVRKVQG